MEVVWGLLKPKIADGKISTIIACCFYSPPRSRKNGVLVDHITVTLQSLLNIHNNAGIIISGDRNNIDIPVLLSIDPSLRQTVRQPTRGLRVLDVIVTNLARFFNEPKIIPPIIPDLPGVGVPSDHSAVSAEPNISQGQPARRTKIWKYIRPLPESLLDIFETKMSSTNFDILSEMPVQQMVETFQQIVNSLLCEVFPEKMIIISPEDRPWFNEQLRLLKRQRMRQYQRHGKNDKYNELKTRFDEKLKHEMLKYLEKIAIQVSEGQRGSTYPALKRLGLRPGEEIQSGFQLPMHAEQNLSSAQSAEVIAEHFS